MGAETRRITAFQLTDKGNAPICLIRTSNQGLGMNRKDLTLRVAQRTSFFQKEVDQILGALIVEIQEQLAKGECIKIQGLGTFEVKARAPRTARNLSDGGTLVVPGRRVPAFKPSQFLKELIDK